MQQTEKYKLNLIETTDPFSPAALNENTQKLEAAIAAGDAADTALARRVTVLEGFKFACGRYTGTGVEAKVNVGFTPVAVFVQPVQTNALYSYLQVAENPSQEAIRIVEGGFIPKRVSGDLSYITNNAAYVYLAFG